MARIPVPKTLRRVLSLLVLAAIVEYLVLPQVAGARHAIHLVVHGDVWLVLLGVALEAASLVAYSCLTRSLLPKGCVRFNRIFRINMSTLSLSHVVPGGTAAGASLGYRLFTASDVEGAQAGFALGTQGLGSAVVLNCLLWIALVVSIPLYGFNPLYLTAALLGVLLIGFVAGITVLMTRAEERAVRLLRAVARHLPLLQEDSVESVFRRLADSLQSFGADAGRLSTAVAWAAANWGLDIASLWVFLAAFAHGGGRFPDPDGLIVAYGLANVLAAIPVTPGGLGVIEGVLTPVLVGFGMSRAVAILGVLAWRLVNFWLPIPAGALAYVSLRLGPKPALDAVTLAGDGPAQPG
jgi:uncharacterized protein (TIRG00374 family)